MLLQNTRNMVGNSSSWVVSVPPLFSLFRRQVVLTIIGIVLLLLSVGVTMAAGSNAAVDSPKETIHHPNRTFPRRSLTIEQQQQQHQQNLPTKGQQQDDTGRVNVGPAAQQNNNSERIIIEIIEQILAWQKEYYNRSNNSFQQLLPFVTLSYAQSMDGHIALSEKTTRGTSTSNLAISGPESQLMTHGLRSIHDAILVGGNTLSIDNPRLTNRLWPKTTATTMKSSSSVISTTSKEKSSPTMHLQQNQQKQQKVVQRYQHQPRPVVLDTHFRHVPKLLLSSQLSGRKVDGSGDGDCDGDSGCRAQNLIVYCSPLAYEKYLTGSDEDDDTLRLEVKKAGISVRPCPTCTVVVHRSAAAPSEAVEPSLTNTNNESLPQSTTTATRNNSIIILDLYHVLTNLKEEFGIQSVMVEGGAQVLNSFIRRQRHHHDGKTTKKKELQLVNAVCVTIAPLWLGINGIPALTSFDGDSGDECIDTSSSIEELSETTSTTTTTAQQVAAAVDLKQNNILPRWFVLGKDCVLLSQWKQGDPQ